MLLRNYKNKCDFWVSPFQKAIKKLKFKPLKPKENGFSHASDLQAVRSEENRVVKKFLAVSPEFMQIWGRCFCCFAFDSFKFKKIKKWGGG